MENLNRIFNATTLSNLMITNKVSAPAAFWLDFKIVWLSWNFKLESLWVEGDDDDCANFQVNKLRFPNRNALPVLFSDGNKDDIEFLGAVWKEMED